MKSLLKLSSFLAVVAGAVLILGGLWGISFTYKNIARENITTPEDASIPNASVRGPKTLMAQADVIRKHTLETTEGKTYAEMPRQVEQVDENGNVVLGEDGKPVMVPNAARNMWVTATTLTTALNLGILTYAFSAFALLMGVVLVLNGFALLTLNSTSKKR